MKKIVFLIAIMAILFACVPAPVKAQGVPHQYNIATTTTPIGRYIVSGDKLWVLSTGQIIEVTASFGSTATPSSIILSGSYKYYPSGNSGLNTLTPATNGSGSVGTTGLRWGTGFINNFTAGTATVTTESVTTLKGVNISASDSTAGYKIRGASSQWYIIKVTASGALTVTTTTAP